MKAAEGYKRLWQFENNKEVYDIFTHKKIQRRVDSVLPDIVTKADELSMDETLLKFVICTETQERNRFLNNLQKNII